VLEEVVPLVAAPLLVGAATLAARRWDHRIAGLVGAFPAIVGPVLLIGAQRHGTGFAAQAATGTLAGLAALAGFAVAYGRTAPHASWPVSLAAGWLAAAATAALAGAAGTSLSLALATAVASLALAYRLLPRTGAPAPSLDPPRVGLAAPSLDPPRAGLAAPSLDPPRGELGVRMALTALLVFALAAAGGRLGPTASGILAALPVLACLLAAFTHQRHGGIASAQLLRGMLAGMAGFVAFCALVAGLVDHAGVALAFTAATAVALACHAAAVLARAG
jgi:hypothetical protein